MPTGESDRRLTGIGTPSDVCCFQVYLSSPPDKYWNPKSSAPVGVMCMICLLPLL